MRSTHNSREPLQWGCNALQRLNACFCLVGANEEKSYLSCNPSLGQSTFGGHLSSSAQWSQSGMFLMMQIIPLPQQKGQDCGSPNGDYRTGKFCSFVFHSSQKQAFKPFSVWTDPPQGSKLFLPGVVLQIYFKFIGI